MPRTAKLLENDPFVSVTVKKIIMNIASHPSITTSIITQQKRFSGRLLESMKYRD
jgi:hypothetical protein